MPVECISPPELTHPLVADVPASPMAEALFCVPPAVVPSRGVHVHLLVPSGVALTLVNKKYPVPISADDVAILQIDAPSVRVTLAVCALTDKQAINTIMVTVAAIITFFTLIPPLVKK